MKNVLIILFAACAVGLGWFSLRQQSRITALGAELRMVRAELNDAQQALAQRPEPVSDVTVAEQKARILQETLSQATQAAAKQSEQVAQLEQSLAEVQTNQNAFGELFRNPEMREMIKSQQKAVLGPMLERNYAGLFKGLNLTAEQAEHVKELLLQKTLVAAESGMAMLDTSIDDEKRRELGAQIKSDTEAFDAQIKEFLGEQNYQQFQDYEKTIPDRTSVGQFRDQYAGTPQALDLTQEEQLIRVMTEERTSFKWSANYDTANPGDANFRELLSNERLDQRAQEQARLDQQVLERSRQFLKPEQIPAFEKYLTTQRELQIASMKMAQAMFGGTQPPR